MRGERTPTPLKRVGEMTLMPFIMKRRKLVRGAVLSGHCSLSGALSIQYTIVAFLTSHDFGRGQQTRTQRQRNVQINRDLKRTPRRACCGLRVLRWQGAAHILIYYNRHAVYGHGQTDVSSLLTHPAVQGTCAARWTATCVYAQRARVGVQGRLALTPWYRCS